MKTVKEKTKNNPFFEQTEAFSIAIDADKYYALKVLHEQEGGQVLVQELIDLAVNGIDSLAGYKEMSRDELVTVACTITTLLSVARSLTRAEENLSLADEALKETLHE